MTPLLKNTLITATICILSSLFVVLIWQVGTLGDMGHLGALGAVALITIGAFTGHLLQMLRGPSAAAIPVEDTAPHRSSQIPQQEKAHWDVESTSIIALPQLKASPHTRPQSQGARIRSVGSLRPTRTRANRTMALPVVASTS